MGLQILFLGGETTTSFEGGPNQATTGLHVVVVVVVVGGPSGPMLA